MRRLMMCWLAVGALAGCDDEPEAGAVAADAADAVDHTDGGGQAFDGAASADAAGETTDAAAVDPDGARVAPDVGLVEPDAFVAEPDAFVAELDAALAQPDAAVDPDAGAVEADDCTAVCQYLEGCGSCFQDPAGACLELEACAVLCRAETPPLVATCIADLPACDELAFGACFDDNIGEDDCADACRVLEDCDQCFTGDDGECLSLAACAVICREVTPPAAATCIGALAPESCGDIGACFVP